MPRNETFNKMAGIVAMIEKYAFTTADKQRAL